MVPFFVHLPHSAILLQEVLEDSFGFVMDTGTVHKAALTIESMGDTVKVGRIYVASGS